MHLYICLICENTFGLMNLGSLRMPFASLWNYVQLVQIVAFYIQIEIYNKNNTYVRFLINKPSGTARETREQSVPCLGWVAAEAIWLVPLGKVAPTGLGSSCFLAIQPAVWLGEAASPEAQVCTSVFSTAFSCYYLVNSSIQDTKDSSAWWCREWLVRCLLFNNQRNIAVRHLSICCSICVWHVRDSFSSHISVKM